MTKIPTNTADPEGQQAREDLRALERQSRKWKAREAAALTPEARAAARAKVRETSGKIDKLIAERGGVERGLPRRRDREQIDLGNKRTGGTPPKLPAPPPAPPPVAPPAPEVGPGHPADRPPLDIKLGNHGFGVSTPTGGYDESALMYGPGVGINPLTGALTGTPTSEQLRRRIRLSLTQGGNDGLLLGDLAQKRLGELVGEIERQGTIAPRSAYSLEEIVIMMPNDRRLWTGKPNTMAYYNFANHSITTSPLFTSQADMGLKSSFRGQWWARYSDVGELQSVIAHEFGHHIDSMATGEQFGFYATAEQRARKTSVLQALASELGLSRKVPSGDRITRADLDRAISADKRRIAGLVSEYATDSTYEMLAELWAEYSVLGENARPIAKRMGRLLRQLAEEGAFDEP